MRCSQVNRLIDRYADGRLGARRSAALRAHLATCSDCRAREEAARAIAGALGPGTAPAARAAVLEAPRQGSTVRAPDGFSSRVMAAVYQIEDQAHRSRSRGDTPRRVYRRVGYSFVVTAAVLIASLALPGIAYTRLVGPSAIAAGVSASHPSGFMRIITDAGGGVERALGGVPEQ